MNEQKLQLITIESAKSVYKGAYIDNDLMFFDDIAELPLPNEPRRMGCKLLAVCLSGKVQYSVDTEQHTVYPNDIIIISEGQVTDDYMFSRDCHGKAIMISQEFFDETIKGVHELSSLFLFSRNHPVCHLTQQEVDTVLSYLQILKRKVGDPTHHFRRETVSALLSTMFYDLSNVIYKMQCVNDKRQTRAESIFTQFILLVEKNFRHERRVNWYGQQMCISPKYLSETIKQISRRTPNEWIDNYVTLEIRVLLRNSTKSIKEIAQDLNFPNQSFLGKYFKEHVGMSPSEYRKGGKVISPTTSAQQLLR